MRGMVLDLKRLCVHDGPGLRTTVFLKGCPLQCRWCHNPESVSPTPEIGFARRKCVGCGKCAEVCPTGAHILRDGEHTFNREVCTVCGQCVAACLLGALEMFGQEMSADDVAAAVLEDRTFYATSGGGCTMSGGEPLWQAAFCAEVFRLLRAEGIHCAVDTSGAVDWEAFATVVPVTDLFLLDVKHTDDRHHQQHTGSPVAGILDNLRKLAGCGVPIEVRIPTIPGFNADEASFTGIAELLSGLPNLVGVRLLPYHLARSKYETVGHPDTMPDVPLPDAPTIARLADILRQHGLTVLA
ncbi:glycyl-radical enzyme activating protein [bacterium]|nr:glycyl-radical enzyme activating protein [bacterium]